MQMDSRVAVNGGRSSSSGGDFVKRGTKRDASDSNLPESHIERFEKRLRMLSLRGSEQNGIDKSHLYTPVSTAPAESTDNALSHVNHARSPSDNEFMQVDDTRDRVYIHDLDAELEELESENGKERLVFLPDIEKHFSKLPLQVLAGGQEGSRELVLYNVPKSLSVDESHDSVRKAIIEARQRAREKAVEEAREAEVNGNLDQQDGSSGSSHNQLLAHWEEHPENDPDAMDVG